MSVRLERVAVVGGGPGGAFFARLIRLARPLAQVTLYDTLAPLATFGFGVGLSVSTQNNLARGDPATFQRIFDSAHHGHGTRLWSGTASAWIPGNDQMALARATLLQVLYDQAAAAGVEIVTGARVDAFDMDADLIVAADGVGSLTREAQALDFGADVRLGRQRYIWCGADRALPDAMFAPVRTEFGTFVTHAYPYADDRSTFLVETDEATWRAAGFEHTSDDLPPGATDEAARVYLEEIFAEHLQCRLLGNNSRWMQFRTVRCATWSRANVVLLGDAAHTAHYSVGSGTKLAMEDAIALVDALSRENTVSTALASYQEQRHADVQRLQLLAERSQLWWEGYVRRLEMPPERLLVSFLTRAGNVTVEDFRDRESALADRALLQYAGSTPPADTGIDDWVLSRSLVLHGHTFSSRDARRQGVALTPVPCTWPDPWTHEVDEFIEAAPVLVHEGDDGGIELVGPPDRLSLLQRLDVAERLVSETDLLVCVQGPPELIAYLSAGLVAGRTHLVSLADSDSAGASPGGRATSVTARRVPQLKETA